MTEPEADEVERCEYAAETARVARGNARLFVTCAVTLLILATAVPAIVGVTWGLAIVFALGLAAVVCAYVGGVETERSQQ